MEQGFHGENARRRLRCAIVFVLMAVAFLVITVVNINSGNVHISVGEIARAIFLRDGSEKTMDIVWTIRLPRIITAGILGGALALSGFLLQTFFRNPIAGPFVLGISSGAKMVVAITLIVFLRNMEHVSSYTLIVAAFVGSLIATMFILAVSRRIHNMSALLVAGIMVGYICTGVTEFVKCATRLLARCSRFALSVSLSDFSRARLSVLKAPSMSLRCTRIQEYVAASSTFWL